MFMQQLPKPGPGTCVAVDEWERIRTSAPLNTPALYMTVFAAGDASSSAGVPYTVTVPGVLELVRKLRHGDGRREPHGSLGAVLVAVEVAAGAAQRVVLDDDAEVWAGSAPAVARYESRLETRHAGLHVEAVRGEIVGEDLYRALFLPARLRVPRDVVGHCEQLLVHQLFGAGDHRVAARVARPREPRDELGQGERALELVHAADDVRGGGFFGRRLLRGEWRGDKGDDDHDWERQGGAHRV